MIEFLKITLFCLTFYFTVIRMLSWIKIFECSIAPLLVTFGFNTNTFGSILNLLMWCYQIYFWFHWINII